MCCRTINISRLVAIDGYEVADGFFVPGKFNHSPAVMNMAACCYNSSRSVHSDVWSMVFMDFLVGRKFRI